MSWIDASSTALGEPSRFIGTVMLVSPTANGDRWTPHSRWFEHASRAEHWCKVVVGRKRDASRYWWMEEVRDGERVIVMNWTFDRVPYSDAEEKRMEEMHAATRTTTTVMLSGPPRKFARSTKKRQASAGGSTLATAPISWSVTCPDNPSLHSK